MLPDPVFQIADSMSVIVIMRRLLIIIITTMSVIYFYLLSLLAMPYPISYFIL